MVPRIRRGPFRYLRLADSSPFRFRPMRLRTLLVVGLTVLGMLGAQAAYESLSRRADETAESQDEERRSSAAHAEFKRHRWWTLFGSAVRWDPCGPTFAYRRPLFGTLDPERVRSRTLNVRRNCSLERELRDRYEIRLGRWGDVGPSDSERAFVRTMDGLVWDSLGPTVDTLRAQITAGLIPSGSSCEAEARSHATYLREAEVAWKRDHR